VSGNSVGHGNSDAPAGPTNGHPPHLGTDGATFGTPRQGGAPDRDLGNSLGGHRQRFREEGSPPEGGLLGGTERHSGGGIRTRDLRVYEIDSTMLASAFQA